MPFLYVVTVCSLVKSVVIVRCCSLVKSAVVVQYNITLLTSVNTLIARGMFCGAKYTHHTFTPIIKHLITTANKHPGKKSFIDKNMRKSHWHQALHIT